MKVCCVRCDLPDVGLVHTDEDILGLDVGVDDLTLGMQVVQALKDLKRIEKASQKTVQNHEQTLQLTCRIMILTFSSGIPW